jgi:ABC-type branched-subunit amino acid transport system ATPase component
VTTLVELQNAVFGYGRTLVAGPISLRCSLGEAVALSGAPGSGRSTVLQALLGRADLISGRGLLFGEAIGGNYWRTAPWRRPIGCVWNSRDAPLGLTVAEVLHLTGATDKLGAFVDSQVAAWVANTMVPQRMRSLCATLSGGERTIVAACCSLARSANGLLVFDDLTASLQPSVADQLIELLHAKVQARALGMVFTEESEIGRTRLATKTIDLNSVATEAVLVPNQ